MTSFISSLRYTFTGYTGLPNDQLFQNTTSKDEMYASQARKGKCLDSSIFNTFQKTAPSDKSYTRHLNIDFSGENEPSREQLTQAAKDGGIYVYSTALGRQEFVRGQFVGSDGNYSFEPEIIHPKTYFQTVQPYFKYIAIAAAIYAARNYPAVAEFSKEYLPEAATNFFFERTVTIVQEEAKETLVSKIITTSNTWFTTLFPIREVVNETVTTPAKTITETIPSNLQVLVDQGIALYNAYAPDSIKENLAAGVDGALYLKDQATALYNTHAPNVIQAFVKDPSNFKLPSFFKG